jgi:hypothetical protein
VSEEPLRFLVAPHLVQDLGLNLYTSLSKVLVEFVANAHDADATGVDITMDFARIKLEREKLRAQVKYEQEQCKGDRAKLAKVQPLSQRTLPSEVTISIRDDGCGMTREDLQRKFLVAGRRRRDADAAGRTAGGRLLMGRKGVGKLAGFGVAHTVCVSTSVRDQASTTRITLNYPSIRNSASTDQFRVPEESLGREDVASGGTEITLSDLLYQPLSSQEETISADLADHFWLIGQGDFVIRLNGASVKPRPVTFSFAWPDPATPSESLVKSLCKTEDGQTFEFEYRIRFRDKSFRSSDDRGIRIYAHGRLAAAPTLLNTPTGSHGFKYTDYLDGIVVADFLDDQPDDYIRTDRQAVRWDTPLLTPLRDQLQAAIIQACSEYYKKRQADADADTKADAFTSDLITKSGLPKHRQKAVEKVAAVLWQAMDARDDAKPYQQQVKMFVDNWRQGDLIRSLRDLAQQPVPDFVRLVHEVTELTARELADFANYIDGRLAGIQSLKRIVSGSSFANKKNEKELQQLFERNPWLIDPTFTQFLSANQTVEALFDKLSQQLKVGAHAPPNAVNLAERPDLVFLIGSVNLKRAIVPVEGLHARR